MPLVFYMRGECAGFNLSPTLDLNKDVVVAGLRETVGERDIS